ncbi:MAG: enoyl-CoA hydratase-related protein [Gammaproteobacteria bacterium]|nr:enoyl-CoA hydratase-related protein [Gammaproteobacteria bacterium]
MLHIDGRGVATLTLKRAEKHNAFDDDLIAELTAKLVALDRNERVRAVVLTGAGKSFSAGADLEWMRGMATASEQENQADALRLAKMLRALNFLSKPTIARVNGAAYGGGIGLVACCDIAIGVDTAKFSLSEVKLGLAPATIAPYVVCAIGGRQARRLFVNGEIFSGAEAERIGLLHHCVAAEALDETLERTLHFLLKGGPVAQRESKALALRMAGMTAGSAEKIDAGNAALIARLRVSPEGQEGIGAFLEKRKARWNG